MKFSNGNIYTYSYDELLVVYRLLVYLSINYRTNAVVVQLNSRRAAKRPLVIKCEAYLAINLLVHRAMSMHIITMMKHCVRVNYFWCLVSWYNFQ